VQGAWWKDSFLTTIENIYIQSSARGLDQHIKESTYIIDRFLQVTVNVRTIIFKFVVRFSSHIWNRFQFLVRANYTVFFCLTNARSPKANLTERWDETSFMRQVGQKSIAAVVSFICQFFLICNFNYAYNKEIGSYHRY
jgi:hypothetical protein